MHATAGVQRTSQTMRQTTITMARLATTRTLAVAKCVLRARLLHACSKLAEQISTSRNGQAGSMLLEVLRPVLHHIVRLPSTSAQSVYRVVLMQERVMGPAGVGMALLNGRAAAAAARTEKILEDARSAREATEGGLGWVPARDASLGRRPVCAVPPLLELCVRLIRDNIEDVESLWGLPDAIKVRHLQSCGGSLFSGRPPHDSRCPGPCCQGANSCGCHAILLKALLCTAAFQLWRGVSSRRSAKSPEPNFAPK